MPFAKGNKHGGRKPDSETFGAVLQRAIKQGDPERLRRMADKVLDLGADGERWAVEFLADRLDGKARQQIEMEVDASLTFNETIAKAADIRGKLRKPAP
jgi:hypothetical protein